MISYLSFHLDLRLQRYFPSGTSTYSDYSKIKKWIDWHFKSKKVLMKAQEQHINLLGYMLMKVAVIAQQQGLNQGYRLVINEGKTTQI